MQNKYDYDQRDYQTINDYIEVLDDWDISIDHEDGSTAPFTSVALQTLFPDWRY